MKRTELVVGAELYYSRERDWAEPEYAGKPRGERVRVLAIDPWEDGKSGPFDRRPLDDRIRECAKGGGVLVERVSCGLGKPYRDVVPLAHLKGDYDAIHAQVTTWIRARDEANATAEDQRLRRRSRAEVAAASVNVQLNEITHNGRNVTVDLATFEAMAAALAEQEWRHER